MVYLSSLTALFLFCFLCVRVYVYVCISVSAHTCIGYQTTSGTGLWAPSTTFIFQTASTSSLELAKQVGGLASEPWELACLAFPFQCWDDKCVSQHLASSHRLWDQTQVRTLPTEPFP